jgi:hypothetical protein
MPSALGLGRELRALNRRHRRRDSQRAIQVRRLRGRRLTRRCRRTGASVTALPLAHAAERQYRYAAL